ncbi:glycosyltransferase [Thermoactinospora rubra]|uniref:glycosyltransferase n=1 Tax=Thermoactinospora rubra TaxID=1088767 RepID=UPI000A10B6B7|nr:glycosyltransferase [Thermoactinospora rubra]
MKVAIVALGSRGDTQPCVALGRGLAGRGHEVVVVAASRYAELVARAKIGPGDVPVDGRSGGPVGGAAGRIEHAPVSVDPVAIVESEEGRAWLRSGPLGFVRGFRTVVEPLAEKLVAEVDAACRDADLVLAPALGALGRHLSDRYGMPYAIMHFQPSEPTTEFPNPLIPARTLGRLGNRASYALVERLSWLLLGGMANRLRAGVLGLGPLRGSPFALDRRDRVPVLCGVSPLVVPRPRDWPGHVHLTGAWRLAGGGLPKHVEDFCRAGPPPLFAGFGSMSVTEELAEQVVGALRLAGMRAVLQGLPAAPGEDLLLVDEVPHDRLFPLVAAVVHHGGAGTTATALAAGVPSVVCPFFSDQPFWGRRVEALGAGPRPLPVSRVTARALAARIRQAVLHCQEKSAQLGRQLGVEDGVNNAVDLIEATRSSG